MACLTLDAEHHVAGALYYLYMTLVSTFCTNSINILAGINGLEVSQALIIALSIAINDALYLPWRFAGAEWSAGMAHGSPALVERHLLSLYFMLPLAGVCAALLYHNRFVSPLVRLVFESLKYPDVQISRDSLSR